LATSARETFNINDLSVDLNPCLIEGDVFNPLDLQSAIKSQDAVIIVLGSGKDRKNSIRSEGTKNIIQAMQQNLSGSTYLTEKIGRRLSGVFFKGSYKMRLISKATINTHFNQFIEFCFCELILPSTSAKVPTP
jgi:hypothetical protein